MEQSYVGRGNYANVSSPTVKNDLLPPSTIDNRQPFAKPREVRQKEEHIFSLITDFLGVAINPVEAVNFLLYESLTESPAGSFERDRLKIVLYLTAFLYDLRTEMENLACMVEGNKGEVSHEE